MSKKTIENLVSIKSIAERTTNNLPNAAMGRTVSLPHHLEDHEKSTGRSINSNSNMDLSMQGILPKKIQQQLKSRTLTNSPEPEPFVND